MKTTRVVVIGAGVGGLTCAALLAKAGYEVTVLEAHVEPGGCATTFFHKGFRFDAGATLVGGFQPTGPHAQIDALLGVDWPVEQTEPAMQIWLPSQVITRYGDAAQWQDERRRAFPQRAAERFWLEQERVADQIWRFAASAPPFPPVNLDEAMRLMMSFRPAYAALLPLVFQSVGGWANRLGATGADFRTFLDAQLLISAQTTSARANALYGATALDLARQGVFHVRGGVGQISEVLAQAVTRFGGQIHYRQEVTRVEVTRGRASAVSTQKGGRWEADVVVANVTPWNFARLVGDDQFFMEKNLQKIPSQWGAFTLYLGVDAEAIPVGLKSDHHQIIRDPSRPLGEGNSVFLSLSPAWDASRAPAGKRAVTISTHTAIEPWWKLRNDPLGRDAYEERRNFYAERLLDAVETVLPEIRKHIFLKLLGTPVTFSHFTRRHLGMVGGFPQHALIGVRGPRTALPNAWLVGDSVFPGQSTAGVTLSGMRVGNTIRRQQKLGLLDLKGESHRHARLGGSDSVGQRTLASGG